jgi:putative transposase
MRRKSTAISSPMNPNYGHRDPAEIIRHAVWLYFRFTLSFRNIDELLAARDIFVTYETIRQRCQTLAHELRRWHPRRGDQWHLDEIVLTMVPVH